MEELVKKAKAAVDRMFYFTGCSQTVTFNALVEIIEYCKDLLDALPDAEQNK